MWAFVLFINWIIPVFGNENNISLLLNLLQAINKPCFVVAPVCWNLDSRASLVKQLSMKGQTQSYVQPLNNNVPMLLGEEQYTLIVIDPDCYNHSSAFLTMALNQGLYRAPYQWLLLPSKTHPKVECMAYTDHFTISGLSFQNNSLLADTTFIVASEDERNRASLQMVYKRYKGGDLIFEDFDAGIVTTPTSIRRLNLKKTVLPISYVLTDQDSINHLEDFKDGHIDTITKVILPITNQLLDMLNAERSYVFTNSWGYLVNGSWSGMIGQMVKEEVEIGGTPMFFTAERLSVVEFIASPIPTRSKFVFRSPKLSYEDNVFLLPFRMNVWYCCVASVFILGAGLLAVTAWEWKKPAYDKLAEDAGVLRASWSDVAVFVLGAACQQGSTVELKDPLGRVVMFILFLSFMFLYTSFSANIVALLQSSSGKIKTLNDLLHSRMGMGVDDTLFNHFYFTHATEPVRKAIYEQKIAPPGVKPRFYSMEEGVEKIREGLFAFHMEIGVGYNFVGKLFHEDEKCGLQEIQYLQVPDPFLAINKYSSYREMFKIGMRRIQEYGLASRETSLFYAKKPHCTGKGNSFVTVTLIDCYPAFIILVYGVTGSVMLFTIEHLLKKREMLVEGIRVAAKNPRS